MLWLLMLFMNVSLVNEIDKLSILVFGTSKSFERHVECSILNYSRITHSTVRGGLSMKTAGKAELRNF